MKVKEAQEKLYITYNGYGVFDEDSTVERTKDSQTEYTRTDVLIERACKYISYHQCEYIDFDDLKKYMKEE